MNGTIQEKKDLRARGDHENLGPPKKNRKTSRSHGVLSVSLKG